LLHCEGEEMARVKLLEEERLKLHRDEAVTDDMFFAAFLAYAGFNVMKCVTVGRLTKWIFLIPSCDLDIMRKDFDEDREVQSKSYTNSIRQVMSFQSAARRNGGELLTPAWKQAIGI
jgi:hypothetical protein